MRRAFLASACVLSLVVAAPGFAAVYSDQDGHTVNVLAPSLPADPARDQAYVDKLGSYVHGAEMSLLTVNLAADQAELVARCGDGAAGCYRPGENTLFVPGYRTPEQLRVLLAHEFGHHIANHRVNPPGSALAQGTKRWATYEGVCAGLASGQYGTAYENSPGEAFAHAYAMIANPDQIQFWFFDDVFRPDQQALSLISEDVLTPWTAATATTIKGKVKRKGKPARKTIELPLDGELEASLKPSRKLRKPKLSLEVAGQTVAAAGKPQTLDYEVCGARMAKLVVRAKTKGRFKIALSRP